MNYSKGWVLFKAKDDGSSLPLPKLLYLLFSLNKNSTTVEAAMTTNKASIHPCPQRIQSVCDLPGPLFAGLVGRALELFSNFNLLEAFLSSSQLLGDEGYLEIIPPSFSNLLICSCLFLSASSKLDKDDPFP